MGEQEAHGLAFWPCGSGSAAEEACDAARRSPNGGDRGNSDPLRLAAVQPRGARELGPLGPLRPREVALAARGARRTHSTAARLKLVPENKSRDNADPPFCLEKKYGYWSVELQYPCH